MFKLFGVSAYIVCELIGKMWDNEVSSKLEYDTY